MGFSMVHLVNFYLLINSEQFFGGCKSGTTFWILTKLDSIVPGYKTKGFCS